MNINLLYLCILGILILHTVYPEVYCRVLALKPHVPRRSQAGFAGSP